MFPDIVLEFCSRSNPDYKRIRGEHYVTNKGSVGRQIHFLIWHRKQPAGIISAGSAVQAVGARDKFFGVTAANRDKLIQQIVNNTVCRMTKHERGLMQHVLSIWRKVVPFIWFDLYATETVGFETFIEEDEIRPGERRDGHTYKGDNWQHVGETAGVAKSTKGCKDFTRKKTDKKLVFVRRSDDFSWMHEGYGVPKRASSYRGKTAWERKQAKALAKRRKYLNGKCYYLLKRENQPEAVCFTPLRNVFAAANLQ